MFFYCNNSLKIGKFIKIITINDKELVVKLKNGLFYKVTGSNLAIDFFDKNEIYLIGDIERIEINNE